MPKAYLTCSYVFIFNSFPKHLIFFSNAAINFSYISTVTFEYTKLPLFISDIPDKAVHPVGNTRSLPRTEVIYRTKQ